VKRFDRYIARQVLLMSLLVAMVLIALFSFISFIGDVDETGQGRYGLLQLAGVTVLMMPTALYTLLPVVALLGTMAGMGMMASQSELTALRAAGVSTFRLAGSALIAGLLTATLAVSLGDVVAPWTADQAEQLKTRTRFNADAERLQRPVWLRAGNHVIHAFNIEDAHTLGPAEVFEFDPSGRLLRWTEVARMTHQAGTTAWQLHDYTERRFFDQRIETAGGDQGLWNGSLDPDVLQLLLLEADSTSIRGLLRLVDYLDANGLDTVRAERALWRKITVPFTVLAMTFFAVPFVFGSLRDSGMGQRLFVGVLIGVGFFVVNEVSLSLAQLFQWPVIFGAGLPSAVLVVIGYWRLRRAR
jgi:lipopolysaccharide export system permease protein